MIPRISVSTFGAALIAAVLAAGCGTVDPAPGGDAPARSAKPDAVQANLDPSVDPGDDFFQYAAGTWLAKNPIPPSESSWSVGNLVEEELYTDLRKVNENAVAANAEAGTEPRKIGDFWSTAMDEEKAQARGIHPLDAELQRIDRVKSASDALDAAFAFRPIGDSIFFGLSVDQDEKNSGKMAVHLEQDGLGLPERDFYFNAEAGIAHIRDEYVAHMARVLQLLGRSEAASRKDAGKVMTFETALAKASRKLEDLRDPGSNYHVMRPARLTAKFTPSIDWKSRLAGLGMKPDSVIVGQPEFFAALERLLRTTPTPVLRDYLRLHLVADYSPFLSREYSDEEFSFRGTVLNGQTEQRDRYKRVIDQQDSAMGMIVGKAFVAAYVPESARARYASLVEGIRDAYRERIERLDWMSDSTRARAQDKLARLNVKVGYPDRWTDMSALVVGIDSWADNMRNAARWRFADSLAKLGKPVDRTEWHITPQTYNAYYSPQNNEIVLPAAAFRVPGYADAELDDAVIYGYAAASTIGHEITHGFDDEGRQFDAEGNLQDWWTADDAKKFDDRAQMMVAQYDAYEPLPGMHLNGKATLGENIADYGGLLLGMDAFRKTQQYKDGAKIAGLTPMQRYFLGYTLSWIGQPREERLRARILSDVHSPAKWRVIGPLSNIPDFHQAFGVKPGQAMWRDPAMQVHIW